MLPLFRTALQLQQRRRFVSSAAASWARPRAAFRSRGDGTPLLGGDTCVVPLPTALRPLHAAKAHVRTFATTLMPEEDVKKRLEEFQDLFVDARYCIEDCNDAAETTYFDEEAEAAKDAVTAAVGAFDSLIGDMEDADQKNRVLRSNGLKVEQLKGELAMALNGGHH